MLYGCCTGDGCDAAAHGHTLCTTWDPRQALAERALGITADTQHRQITDTMYPAGSGWVRALRGEFWRAGRGVDARPKANKPVWDQSVCTDNSSDKRPAQSRLGRPIEARDPCQVIRTNHPYDPRRHSS